MAEFRRVTNVASIPPGKAAVFEVGGRQIALFNVQGIFYAVDSTCSHRGGPLVEGSLHGTTLTCPWHGAQFDVTSGQVLEPPAPASIASYATQVEDDRVWVAIP